MALKDVLEEKEISFYEFAAMMKTSKSAVYRWVRGGDMTLKTAQKMVRLLGCKISDLPLDKEVDVTNARWRKLDILCNEADYDTIVGKLDMEQRAEKLLDGLPDADLQT